MWKNEGFRELEKRHPHLMPCDKHPCHLPSRRADCENGIRPCPYISCRHHIGSNVTKSGSIQYRDHEGMKQTCVLDLANERSYTHKEIADFMGVTKQAIEQIEKKALAKLASSMELREHIPDP